MRAKLSHELMEYSMSHPTVHINLYNVRLLSCCTYLYTDNSSSICVFDMNTRVYAKYTYSCLFLFIQTTIEEISYLCRVIDAQDDFNHIILLGYAHPEPMVQLAAIHSGYSVVQPSQYFSSSLLSANNPFGMSSHSYDVTQLRKNLISIYTTAGVKNEKLLLLLTDKEILHESFMTCVYEFVKGGAISALFSNEEKSRIVNAVRSDVTHAGLEFNREVAWNFFLK